MSVYVSMEPPLDGKVAKAEKKPPNSQPLMDLHTFEQLSRRVSKLEAALAVNDTSPSSPTLVEQLDAIKALWDTVLNAHPTLKTLYDLGETFPGPNRNDIGGGDTCMDQPVVVDPDYDLKIQTISLQSDAIVEAHANLCRLDAIDKTKAINPFDGLPLDFHANDVSAVNSYSSEIKKIAKNYDLVLLKSMLVFEQFADAVSDDNAFWVNSMLKLKQLGALVSKLKREKQAESPY